jgi:hypothetical protein
MARRSNLAKVEGRTAGLSQSIEVLVAATLDAAEQAVLAAAMHMEKKIKDKLSGERSGRTYYVNPQRGGSGGAAARGRNSRRAKYTASAPGEPPARKRGKLSQSVTHTRPKRTGDNIESLVGVDLKTVPYARRLEFGGASRAPKGHTVMIEPRPYMRPTFFEQEAEVVAIMQREMSR